MRYDISVILQPIRCWYFNSLRQVTASLLMNLACWIVPHQMTVIFEAESGKVSKFVLHDNGSEWVVKSYAVYDKVLENE